MRKECMFSFRRPFDSGHSPQNFVHCHRCNDRTGMMIAASRMGAQGWTAEQAMKEMHSSATPLCII
jgi:hypothetical protein